MVFWTQALLAFLVWIAVGTVIARRGKSVRQWAARRGRNAAPIAMGGLLAAVLILFGSMSALAKAGGFGGTTMSPPVWFVVTLAGGAFIGAQTAATIVLAAIARQAAVTSRVPPASTIQDSSYE